MSEPWLARTAAQVWDAIGVTPTPPRDLAPLVSRAFPLSVVALPALDLCQIERWFHQRNVPYRFLCHNRALCGCIIAVRGHGLLFIDANDPAAEQRFTVAHEVAHFLLDYLEPRRAAIAALGESIRPVLDGERPPTTDERIHAVLGQVRLGIYYNLMPRDAQGDIDQGYILRAEDRADRLALELLAPAEAVLAAAAPLPHPRFERAHRLFTVLCDQFGLPPAVARTYSATLARQTTRESLTEWFGL